MGATTLHGGKAKTQSKDQDFAAIGITLSYRTPKNDLRAAHSFHLV